MSKKLGIAGSAVAKGGLASMTRCRRPITGEPAGIYLRGDQSQGRQRVHTCVGTNYRGASGYIPAWGPITGEPAVHTCVGTNHRGAIGYIPAWGPITGEPA
eukprot:1130932-Prorocentrum_minimum.AAC.1